MTMMHSSGPWATHLGAVAANIPVLDMRPACSHTPERTLRPSHSPVTYPMSAPAIPTGEGLVGKTGEEEEDGIEGSGAIEI